MGIGVLVVCCVGGAALMAGGLLWFAPGAAARRKLRATRAVPIGTLQAGQTARVRGRIVASEPLITAPASGRQCVYYLAVTHAYEKIRGRGIWREIGREQRGVDFLVEDDSGRVRVHMHEPEVDVVVDVHSRSGDSGFVILDKRLSEPDVRLSRREGALEPGEVVTVLGVVREGESGLVLDAPEGGRLLVSDDPRLARG